MGIDQVDRGDRRVEQLRGKRDDVVEGLLGRGIENRVLPQRGEPFFFGPRMTDAVFAHDGSTREIGTGQSTSCVVVFAARGVNEACGTGLCQRTRHR